jgi:tRNA(His) guanylyltransferase
MAKDSLGDRMKNYEGRSQTYLPRRTYTMVRLDGKSFHSYTKHCKRPYDLDLMSDMDNTAKYLCENIQGCRIAYIQSDEITLVLTDFETIHTDAWFDGNVQKITSISASMATAKFNQLRLNRINNEYIPKISKLCQEDVIKEWRDQGKSWEEIFLLRKEYFVANKMNILPRSNYMAEYFVKTNNLAHFDSRCWIITEPVEVYNCLLWRQQDATRNSIQMTGQAHFSHKKLQHKSCNEIQEMLWQEKNINWDDMPTGFKRGRCVVKETYDTIDTYKNDGSMVNRSKWVIVEPPVFSQEQDWIFQWVPKINHGN